MKSPSFSVFAGLLPLLLSASLLTACDDAGEVAVGDTVEQAETYLAEGDLDAAVIELKNALQRDAENPRARFLLGQIYLQRGNGLGAKKEFSRAASAGYSSDELQLQLARANLMIGEPKAVLAIVPEDLELDTRQARDLYIVRGEALMAERRIDEAVETFERVLKKEDLPRAHGDLARIAIHKGDSDEAKAQIAAALELEPNERQWIALKGELLLRERRYEEAKAVFEQFADTDKGFAEGQVGYVRALVGAGELDAAKAWVEELKRWAPADIRVSLLSALVDLEQGDFAAAKVAAARVLAHDDQNERARYVAGVAAYQTGEYEAANKHLTQYLLTGNPRDQRAIYYLGATKLRLGEPQDAYDVLRREPALESSAAGAALLAQAAVQSGDLETGLSLLERLAESRPEDARTQARLGLIRTAAGETDAGVEALENAVDQDPTLDAIAQRLVLEQIRAGKLDEALTGARQLTERYPDRAVGYILQGMVYLRRTGLGAADPYFRKAWEVEPGNPSAGLNLAQIEANAGNLEGAASILRRVIDTNPDSLQSLLFLADIEGKLGNPDRREKLLRDAVTADEALPQTRVLLARHLMQSNRPSEAIAVLQPVLKGSGQSPALLETAGIAYLMQGQPSRALVFLRQLKERQPDSVTPYFLSAQAHVALDQLEAARVALEHALEVDSDHFDSRKLLASVLQRSNRYPESLEQLKVAEEMRPTDAAIADLQARAQFVLNDPTGAIAAAERAQDLAPNTERAIALARFFWSAERRTEALATLEQWVENNQAATAAHLVLASFLFQMGDRQEALEHYEVVAEAAPNSASVQNDYAWALWKSGKPEDALSRAERAHELAPENPRVKDTLGVILLGSGDEERGLELVRAAATALPDSPSVQFHLASAYAQTGQRAEAMQLLTKLLEAGGNFDERQDAESLLESLRQ